MSNLELLNSYIPVVENAIIRIGAPVDMCRTDNPLLWSLKKGSASIWIQLQETAAFAGTKGLMVIGCPFMEVPTDAAVKASLLEELMKMNHQSSVTSFTMAENGVIYLLANRFITGMDTEEVLEMLEEMGVYADYFDDILKAKYGNYMVNREGGDPNTRG